jgi:UDP-glucose 4-epimerase
MSDIVLITGGLGYLGGRICCSLQDAWSLRIGTRRTQRPSWLHAGELVPLELGSEKDLAAACDGVCHVVHLAALNENDSLADPERALLVNGLGTAKLLRAATRAGVERFIYFSTAHVYGKLAGTISESSLPRPVHPYAISHHAGEDFVLAAQDERRLTGIVVRLSNSLGAPADPDVNRWTLIANDLCRQAVTHGTLTLRTSGVQRRDFIALSDVCRAVQHLLAIPPERCGDGLFNLGGESPLQVFELAEFIADCCQKVLGFRPPILRPQPPPGETVAALDYRIDKLKRTGFQLSGDFAAEIDATLKLCASAFRTVATP